MNLNSIITGPARIGLELGRWAVSTASERGSQAIGAIQERLGGGGGRPDDGDLTHRVEAELFSSRSVARGKIDVDVEDGVVWLRGEAKTPELIIELEERAAAIPGVERIENLVRVEKPKGTRTKPKRSAEERQAKRTKQYEWTSRRFNADETTDTGEPTPRELADRGEGRQPAPLGAPVESPAAPFPSTGNGNGEPGEDTPS